jgi:EEF1A N-terminal glycine/lysine methyltransferase
VCELGAGTGLPGLYAFSAGAGKVVLTDYPDENILHCLWDNVRRNIDEGKVLSEDSGETDERWCTVEGYEWGKDTDGLRRLNPVYQF